MGIEEKNNIRLIHGLNSFLSKEKLDFWLSAFNKKYGENGNLEILDGPKINPSDFETNLLSLPFLSEKRLIIIKGLLTNDKEKESENMSKLRTRIAKAIEKTPDFCTVIFYDEGQADKRTTLYKTINKIGKVDEAEEANAITINKWTREFLEREKIKISPVNTTYLSQQCGFNMWKIQSELKKLSVFSNGSEISKEIIDDMVKPSISTTIFKLTDFISAKDKISALKTLKTLVDSGEEIRKIFFMLVRHFRILIQVYDLISKNNRPKEIAEKMKEHPFTIQKTSLQSKNFKFQNLKEIYNELFKIEISSKSNEIKTSSSDSNEFELALEKLIIKACEK